MRKRSAWPWIAAASAAVTVMAGVGLIAYSMTGSDEDSGVVACKRAADRAASGQTADQSDDGDVRLLLDSEHADLRDLGAAIEKVTATGDLAEAMKVAPRMISACARHGVVISPASW